MSHALAFPSPINPQLPFEESGLESQNFNGNSPSVTNNYALKKTGLPCFHC
jgi:hypothetical protein